MTDDGTKRERVGGRVINLFDPSELNKRGVSWEVRSGPVVVNAARRDMGLDRTDDDPVNHPSHYKQYDGFEVIDITEQLNFNLGNAVTRILRAGFEADEIEDLHEARFYIDREIKRLEKKNAAHR